MRITKWVWWGWIGGLLLGVGLACAKPTIVLPDTSIQVEILASPAEAIVSSEGRTVGQVPQRLVVSNDAKLMDIGATLAGEAPVEKRLRYITDRQVEITFLFGKGKSKMFNALGLAKKGYSGIIVFDYGAGYVFDVNKADIKPEFQPMLDNQAALLRTTFQGIDVLVCGHTDGTGSRERNLALSVERANAVAHALVERGMPVNRLEAQGFGSQYPVASNETVSGRTLNRRTEVILPTHFSSPEAAPAPTPPPPPPPAPERKVAVALPEPQTQPSPEMPRPRPQELPESRKRNPPTRAPEPAPNGMRRIVTYPVLDESRAQERREVPECTGLRFIVALMIRENGTVKSARCLSSGSPDCVKAALATGKEFRFKPALDAQGQPIEGEVVVAVTFEDKK